MAARFVREKELKSFLKEGYQVYPTELGGLYVPPGAPFTKDTVTLGFERVLVIKSITVDGIEMKHRC